MGYTHHLRSQLPTIAAFGGLIRKALTGRAAPRGELSAVPVPGPRRYALVAPPDAALVRDFVTFLGGDPGAYDGVVPAHLFPQWTFPSLVATLEGLPIPAHKLLNGGFHMEVHRPLPLGEALEVEAWLAAIDEDDRKIRLTQRVVTGTASAPGALTIDFFPVVPKRARKGGAPEKAAHPATAGDPLRDPRVDPTIPTGSLADLGELSWSSRAGLDFALLTGDFNPIHWLAPAARLSGFKSVILHGFASAGQAIEAWIRTQAGGDPARLHTVTARFNAPLHLPARGRLWANADGSLWAGPKQGERSWMSAHITAR